MRRSGEPRRMRSLPSSVWVSSERSRSALCSWRCGESPTFPLWDSVCRDAGTREGQAGQWGKSKSRAEVRRAGRRCTDRFTSRKMKVPGGQGTASEETGIPEINQTEYKESLGMRSRTILKVFSKDDVMPKYLGN